MDGPFGPITIYGPTQIPYDVDLGPVILVSNPMEVIEEVDFPPLRCVKYNKILRITQNDWFHTNSSDFIRKGFSIPAVITFPDNNLINGKMDYDCSLITNGSYPAQCTSSAGLAKFKFMPGKTHRLRLINAGSAVTQKFTIDGYRMTVIANDFVPVKPYTTNVVTLGVGQRTDILVKATGKGTDSVWMRADMDTGCFPGPTQPHALAAIYYPEANQNARPTTKATGWVSGNCGNVSIHFFDFCF
jgi:FtsP/CotA-like multicopper oxidase with cupredoxin domain